MGKNKDAGNTASNANVSARAHTHDRRNGNSKLGPSDRSLPATNPGLTSLDIHIPQLPPFWKPIQLRRTSSPTPPSHSTSANSSLKPFSVGEVLDAIHRYLQQPITGKEYKTLPEALQKVIARAYWQRHDAVLSAGRTEEAERIKKSGIRRVDALAGYTQFVAFVPAPAAAANGSAGAGEVWQVILSAPAPASPVAHAHADGPVHRSS
ncbi:hypothetical protein A7U60_g794 [Sanghuangporus baumii]|uniref:DUF6699 domain-containing protein n=1 Tax=Sanghuangporus baumii TaxID=108892 RepID=A0A9Q5I591_SANBA|nr:hypothetical protein A7U60_g794 [Sanghuangporus baumii]